MNDDGKRKPHRGQCTRPPGRAAVLHDQYKLEGVAPRHCTREPEFGTMKRPFGDHYVDAGLGSWLTCGALPWLGHVNLLENSLQLFLILWPSVLGKLACNKRS